MELTKSNLKNLHLVELKNLCKEHGLQHGGSKTQIINRLVESQKIDVVINSHPSSLTPPGKKIVGIKLSDNNLRVQIGKEVEKGRAQLLYYSMGVHYYQVLNSFDFIS